MRHSFALTLSEVDILWERLGLGSQVFPFTVPSQGRLVSERDRIARGVFDGLAERGLCDHGELNRDVEDALVLLATAERTIAACGLLADGSSLVARVATRRGQGVVAVQEPDRLRYKVIRAESCESECASLLPPWPTPPGLPVTITHETTGDAPEHRGFLREDQPDWDTTSDDLRTAQAIFRQPRHATGYFTAFDANRRQLGLLTWIDTSAGRYFMSDHHDSSGQWHSTITPADHSRLTARLTALFS
jgi:hypothetical protein